MKHREPKAGKNPNADRNSSITRVRPRLSPLFEGREKGTILLRSLLNLLKRNPTITDEILNDPGEIQSWCRKKRLFSEKGYAKQPLPGSFEASAPPSGAFLRWLITNPEQLVGDPDASGSELVREKRRALKGLSGADEQQKAMELALLNLDAGGALGAEKKWWALEGNSSIDCLIETEKLVLFVEGKRTEPLSKSIAWYPHRNQVARNLECAEQWAAKHEKAFGVVVACEEGVNENELDASLSSQSLNQSLPHLSAARSEKLLRHYLGKITWQELIREWELPAEDHLPETVSDTPYAITT